jgi:hypothetical protein
VGIFTREELRMLIFTDDPNEECLLLSAAILSIHVVVNVINGELYIITGKCLKS